MHAQRGEMHSGLNRLASPQPLARHCTGLTRSAAFTLISRFVDAELTISGAPFAHPQLGRYFLITNHKAKLFRAVVLGIGVSLAGQASANDNIKSEMSHAIFGGVVAGTVTWGANYRWPEHRALVGFGAAASLGVLTEATSKNGFSALDAGSNALGAAIGALATDEYLLAPVIKREAGHRSYIGVTVVKTF